MYAPHDDDAARPVSGDAPETAKKNEVTGILWLASYPKSGNTWTRNFLHNLLNILEGKDEGEQDINAMNEFTFWEISAKAYEKFLEKPVTESTREEIAAVRPKVQEMIAESTDGLAMVKTHHCLVMDRGVPAINLGGHGGRGLYRAQSAGCRHLACQSHQRHHRRRHHDDGNARAGNRHRRKKRP